ncbi:hypothetical protein HG421_20710 [Xanthomonas campestris pv. badrii]|uniref:Transmembrane protein n=1 Tax=Xanthomonas campestris pv. badrii TaxID=149696 RepID=A0A7Z2VDY4_XANCA|nr:hypothetical protein [Xanthomonas campestris]MCC4603263.1 hypothetical protein [Xanthomonas campestris pv. parthenii]QJD69866.1 hypothetical protein HG421_20710 [Xanthomonas campestris pv. badrii]
MDRSNAEEVARAVMRQDAAEQEARRLKRVKQARWLVEQRKVAGLSLAGFVVGAFGAHAVGAYWMRGALVCSLVASGIGWCWIHWRNPDLR